MIFDIPLRDITVSDIENLVTDKIREGMNLDYKELLIGDTDENKKELLADVSSFANSGGGIIVFGMKEDRDSEKKSTGIPISADGLANINLDKEELRLNQIIRSGLDPRLPGIEMHAVPGFNLGPILLVKVPKSFAAPHMVTFKGSSKFYARTSAGKYQLDVREISSLVLQASRLPERIRSFQQDRLAKIIAADTPVRIRDNATHVVHVIPISVFSGSANFDISSIDDRLSELQPPGALSFDGRFNIHGYVSYPVAGESLPISYIQVFRNGALEIVTARADWILKDGRSYIPSTGYERYVIDDAEQAVRFLLKSDIAAPVIIIPSILGVKNTVLITHENEQGLERMYTFDEDHLLLPDVTLREYNNDVAKTLRPAFDYLWQAGGFPRSDNYKQDGSWEPPRL